ncbi:PREDICTED: RIMS-binding protein 2-like [Priapulus caudatus]|uniref:RIMS-binding protein 2-like n=1 Tax=Priapulus caudatus TaxID=37621 RepID=A0ABM1ENJ5_PRICU|nr:PREDICTED: RIMS-binding protein 2-like [Priapulus caudatus]
MEGGSALYIAVMFTSALYIAIMFTSALYIAADHALIDTAQFRGLSPQALTVRTLSYEMHSTDSTPAPVPNARPPPAMMPLMTMLPETAINCPIKPGPVPKSEIRPFRPDEYNTDSSDRSELSDIAEEQEEEYSEQSEGAGQKGHNHQGRGSGGTLGGGSRGNNRAAAADKGGATPPRTILDSKRLPSPSQLRSVQEGGRTLPGIDQQRQQVKQQGSPRMDRRQVQPVATATDATHAQTDKSMEMTQQMEPTVQRRTTASGAAQDRVARELPQHSGSRSSGVRGQSSDRSSLHHGQDIVMDAEEEDLSDKEVYPGNVSMPHIANSGGSGKENRQSNVRIRRMVALYDYDPQELSPNVDAEVELVFNTGDIIYVYGDIDDDGFFMGEVNGIRGLVPSNFLQELPPDAEVHARGAPCVGDEAAVGTDAEGAGAQNPEAARLEQRRQTRQEQLALPEGSHIRRRPGEPSARRSLSQRRQEERNILLVSAEVSATGEATGDGKRQGMFLLFRRKASRRAGCGGGATGAQTMLASCVLL